jgi:signal peptidase I
MTPQDKNLDPTNDVAEAMFEAPQADPTADSTLKTSTDTADAALDAEAEAIADKSERHLLLEAKAFMGAAFSWIILPLIVVLLIHSFVFQPYHVVGSSMVPTLQESNYLVVSKLGQTQAAIARAFGNNSAVYLPSRGQIIVFHFPKEPEKVFVKRVIGLPGDRVVIKNGKVTVFNNSYPKGFNPDASYEPSNATTYIDVDTVVNPGNVFVVGDNRLPGESYDSRDWGQLGSSYIVGRAVLRLWPLDEVKVLPF